MRAKKTVCFFSVLLLFSGLICIVGASPTTISLRGGGVTINLTFPEEAHPNTTITHNITITSNTAATLRNFTVVIKAPVNSGWQEIFNAQDTFSNPLPMSYNLTLPLPQQANGTLRCFMYVNTSSINDLSTTFYTTYVSEPTFSEIRNMYDELLESYILLNATYTALNETFTNLSAQYETLLEQNKDLIQDYDTLEATYESLLAQYNQLSDDYDSLQANYTSLFANYTALLSEYNQLKADYNSKVATYESLLAQYNKLSDYYDSLDANYRSKINEFGALQTDYSDLNSTRYSLQTSYNALSAVYSALNQTYNDLLTEFNDLKQKNTFSENALSANRIVLFIFLVAVAALIAFIVYLKRKKEEPYVVIRKETVSMKSEED